MRYGQISLRRVAKALAAVLGLIAAPLSAAPPVVLRALPPPLVLAPAPQPPPPARAAPLANSAKIYLSADGATIYIIGAIMDDSFLRFDAVLLGGPKVTTVFLSSPGGLTLEGRLIAALVRKRGLSTYVEHYCASACTQIFVAGRERVIGTEGELGFHQAVGIDAAGETSALAAASTRKLTPLTVFGINGNDTLRLAYEQAGIDPAFIAKALARSHDDMWLPSPTELRAAKVITRQADRAELSVPVGSVSHAQIRALVAPRPLWNAAASALPEAYAQGLNDAWRRANSGSDPDSALSAGRAAIVVAAWSMLATASDPLLDQMLLLYAGAARVQRLSNYPLCKEAVEAINAPLDAVDRAFEQSEDELLIALFAAPDRVPALSLKDARKTFEREIVPQMVRSYLATDPQSTSSSCRLGYKIFEAIDQLPGKQRIRAYRALLSLPEMAAH